MSDSAAKKDIDQEQDIFDEATLVDFTEDASAPLSVVPDEMTSFDIENVFLADISEEVPEEEEEHLEVALGASDEDDIHSFTPPGLDLNDIPAIDGEENQDSASMPDIPSEQTVLLDSIRENIAKSQLSEGTQSLNIEFTGLEKLDKLAALQKIDTLDAKLEALSDLNRLLQMNGEVFEQLSLLNKLDRLTNLKKLDQLEELNKLDVIKELEHLKKLDNLKSLDKVVEISKLENLTELRALDHLKELSKLERLEYLRKLDELDQLEGLDKLNNLDQLNKLDNVGFFEKLEKLDKLNIMNQKFHIVFMGQCLGFLLEIFKFGLAAVFVFYLLSTNAGQKIATKSLTAVGFGSPAQTNLGLMLLQGEVQEPKFEEIISNIRNKIKYDYQRAFSIDNTLTLTQRVHLIKDVLDYDYVYNTTNIREETIKAIRQQVIYSKANILPKIEYDIAMARNAAQPEDEKLLKELKVFFINGNYTEIVQKYHNSKSNLESLRLAVIVATLELYLEDSQTLRQLIAL